MLNQHPFLIGVLVSCIGLSIMPVVGDAVWAQRPGAAPVMPAPKPASIDPDGVIEAIGPGVIKILTVAGESWMLQVSRETKVRVTGKAKKDVLQPGSFVSFSATIDARRSQAQGKVDKLTLFTPTQERTLGVFPNQSGLAATPEAFGAGTVESKPAPPKRRGRRQQPEVLLERYDVAGRITGIAKNGRITVFAPNTFMRPSIEVELAEDPEIKLNLAGPVTLAFTLAKQGDKLHARGKQVAPNGAQVNELSIELAEPFTTVRKKVPPRRRTSRSRRTPADKPEATTEEEPATEEKPKGKEKPK
ncbi:MAG: hypothetical protein ACYTG0_12350 [Planctomycetota bacterium]|jgi:hypothetical protein